MSARFSVIIPLYNKEAEIGRTIDSVLAQTYAPAEIIVVDDGSTDRSAEIVRSYGSPLIKLVCQKNAGETAARNRAMAEAGGDYFALLDADDEWYPDFLERMAALIGDYPDCGIYSSAFDIVNNGKTYPARTPGERGIVESYFRHSMNSYVCIPSASVIPRRVVDKVGGFPEGMKIAGDLYMWIKIALEYPVCFTPERLAHYHMTASNRSAAIYTPEKTAYSFNDFYDESRPDVNEFLARAALGKGIIISTRGDTAFGRETEKFYAYNKQSRRLWHRLRILNRLPRRWRPTANRLYTTLAWKIAKRGL